ncbi:MAG: hypothetical protein QOK48_1006 [Blastocatellia bacterium]|jgi:hypothetical protein|nr:hypothetical protein [Blastocatellia bacterium]
MPDPISLIALGAAVGGIAGKFTDKAWESSERWLKERFGSHAADARKQAQQNAAEFVRQLADEIKALDDEHRVSEAELDAAGRHPQFSALLQRSVLNAAETDDSTKHQLLAQLVATRLQSRAETTLSLASQLASDAIARSTRRQLFLMALECFLEEIRPRDQLNLAQYHHWLEVSLRPFIDFEFHQIDARHLVAIACATYDPTSQLNLDFVLAMKGDPEFVDETFDEIIEVEAIRFQWNEGLAGVALTSVGAIVGGLAFDQITGRKSGKPQWD